MKKRYIYIDHENLRNVEKLKSLIQKVEALYGDYERRIFFFYVYRYVFNTRVA